MKNIRFFLFFASLFVAFQIFAEMGDSNASVPYYGPPGVNPHPPQSELDKKRVAFAESVIHILLMREPAQKTGVKPVNLWLGQERFNLDEVCLKDAACLAKDANLGPYLDSVLQQFGSKITEIQHAHIIPWSMEKYLQNKTGTLSTQVKKEESAKTQPGVVNRAPMAPAQKDDEYMFHVYVQTSQGDWYNLDVFVTEDAKGTIRFQRFFLTPMNTGGGSIPDGAVCINVDLQLSKGA